MNTLSVIVIVKNEAENIRRCLQSVTFANEIIVLDSGSTDETAALAKEYTQKVYHVDWHGYGAQKNLALEKTTCHWILALDADEVVSEELKQEIQSLLANEPSCQGYYIRRVTSYCSQIMYHGEWKNDLSLRLFKKGTGQFTQVPIHEELLVQGKTGQLNNIIRHHSFIHLEQVIDKINRYSTLSAEHKFKQGKKSNLSKAILHGTWTFIRGYFLKRGFLDGKKGFMLAFSNAEGSYYRHLKIMLLDEKS